MKNKKAAIFMLLLFFGLSGVFIFPLFVGFPSVMAIEESSPRTSAALGDFENATVISDDETSWNSGTSQNPTTAVDDSGTIHIVWHDNTDEGSGPDYDIMYSKNEGNGWTNATVISDDETNWNSGVSMIPTIAVDDSSTIHIVWQDNTDEGSGPDYDIMYSKNAGNGWTNATVISDDDTNWNSGDSTDAAIVVDSNNTLHVVWEENTDAGSGGDDDIMYAKNMGDGWTNATFIFDDSTNWNTGNSYNPAIAVDSNNTLHVVWRDNTDEGSGPDYDIMYSKNAGSGWTNATVISDDSTNWNTGNSVDAEIAVDSSGTVHVVWYDGTNGWWGIDSEIMYSKNSGNGWTNATVISDVASAWYDGSSADSSIAVDSSNAVHVVWRDLTVGWWESDSEIMYSKNTGSGWTNIEVISEDRSNWNDGSSLSPSIAVDSSDTIHVVWEDNTDEGSGTDYDIMYTKAIFAEEDGDGGNGLIPGFPVIIFVPIVIGAVSAFILAVRRKTK